jgi:hypothetical protein
MVEEVGELELGDGLPEWELRESRSSIVLLPMELVATILSSRVVAFVGLDGLQVKAIVVDPIP